MVAGGEDMYVKVGKEVEELLRELVKEYERVGEVMRKLKEYWDTGKKNIYKTLEISLGNDTFEHVIMCNGKQAEVFMIPEIHNLRKEDAGTAKEKVVVASTVINAILEDIEKIHLLARRILQIVEEARYS